MNTIIRFYKLLWFCCFYSNQCRFFGSEQKKNAFLISQVRDCCAFQISFLCVVKKNENERKPNDTLSR